MRKQLSVLLIIFFVGIDLNAQIDRQIGITFSPEFAYRKLVCRDDVTTNQIITDYRNNYEKAKLGFTTGISYQTHAYQNLYFRLSALYSEQGYKTIQNWIKYLDPNDPAVHPGHFYEVIHAHFLELNFSGFYQKKIKKVKAHLGFGLSPAYLLDEIWYLKLKYDDVPDETYKHIYTKSNSNRLVTNANMMIGINIPRKDKFDILLEANYKRNLVSTRTTAINIYYWSLGLNFGIFYHLKT